MKTIRKRIIVTATALAAAISVSAFDVPKQGPWLEDMRTAGQVTSAVESYSVEPIEGVWSFPEKEATVGIVRLLPHDTSVFSIVSLETEDIYPEPGTVIGYCIATSDPKIWRVYLYTRLKEGHVTSPKEFTGELTVPAASGNVMLNLEKAHWDMRLNPLALIPHLRRFLSVRKKTDGPAIPFGLRRLYPSNTLRLL